MSTFKPLYATAQSFDITVNSLGNNSANSSAVVDNGTDLNDDVLGHVVLTAGSSGVSASGYAEVCVHPSVDDGTSFAGTTATAKTSGITKRANGFKIAGRIPLTANNQVNELSFSVAALFGGTAPKKFMISIENKSGASLASSGNSAKYQGVQYQSV